MRLAVVAFSACLLIAGVVARPPQDQIDALMDIYNNDNGVAWHPPVRTEMLSHCHTVTHAEQAKAVFVCDCFFPGIDDVVIQRGSLLGHGSVVRSDMQPRSQHHSPRDVEWQAASGHSADVDWAIYVDNVRCNSMSQSVC